MSNSSEIIFNALEQIQFGRIHVHTAWGQSYIFQGTEAGPEASIQVKDYEFFRLLLDRGDIGLGEGYMYGYWDSENLSLLIEFGVRNQQALRRAIRGNWYKILSYKAKHWLNWNSRSGAKKNIRQHYDLGNDFYSQWLDETMTYSSAFWSEQKGLSLSEAQENKYQKLLDFLQPEPGAHILEIGCGWGGFAEYAGARGYRVTGVTISQAQYEYARQRIEKNEFSHRVHLLLSDYRDLDGHFDHVVSIEMIEAVGQEYWKTYFKKIKQLTRPGGKVAIQSIVMNDDDFDQYIQGTDFIQQYIFPGGVLPSPNILKYRVVDISGTQLKMLGFGLDYARTLEVWRKEFLQSWNSINSMGYNHEFRRMWEFYLAYCEGAFRAGKIDVLFLSFQL